MGRTQELLFILTDLVRRKRIAAHPIYVDFPMAIAATELTAKYATLLDADCQELMAWHKLNPRSSPIRFVRDVEESIALNEITSGAIIISASGMCDAGRIKYHLLYNISRAECSILISGFQARGTLGRDWLMRRRRSRFSASPMRYERTSIPSAGFRPMPTRRPCWTGCGSSANRRATHLSSMAKRKPARDSCRPSGINFTGRT